MSDILDKAISIEDYIIRIRRDIHEHPELSGQEVRTQSRVIEELGKLGIPYVKAGSTSIIATLKGAKPGKTVALRCDMDALPILEQSGCEFSSKNEGVFHACGHDGHTAMLLGAAKILSELKEGIKGEVRFFFQEGEETFGGAKKIIEAGGMKNVDAVFGMHLMPFFGKTVLEAGEYDIQPGYKMAGCDTIFVKFEGMSGHGSSPHLAKDTIHPACLFVTDIQGIVTKNVDAQQPVVLSVGKFAGGTKANVISKYAQVDISMRYFDPGVRETIHNAIKRHAKAIADAYEISAEVIIEESALSLKNDEVITKLAQNSAVKIFGAGKNKALPRLMGSEDMPYYFQHAPGAYAFIGFNNQSKDAVYFPHHEKYKIDEDVLKYGAALHAQFALDFLDSEGDV